MRKAICTCLVLLCCLVVNGQGSGLAAKIAAIHGTYKHFVPCGDCTGVETTITLDCDGPCNTGSYSLREESVNSINGDKSAESTGTWSISDTLAEPGETALIISLSDRDLKENTRDFFLFKEGNLEQLDKLKRRVSPPFNLVLKKLDSNAILDLR
jgi:hypothetical protein